jgi:peptidoglycan/xylan/chitin deacetylase (PgdA/CDA1 family)
MREGKVQRTSAGRAESALHLACILFGKWNIDTQDWRQPGAEAIASVVAEQAYPGAIVHQHDGGGDRSQTAEALEMTLETLSKQGYVFEVVCP